MSWDDLIRAMQDSTEQVLRQAQEPPPVQVCRVYHQDGIIQLKSLGPPWQHHDSVTDYVEIPGDQFARVWSDTHRVINGAVIAVDKQRRHVVKLYKSDSGYRVVRRLQGLLLEPNEDWADVEYYKDRID